MEKRNKAIFGPGGNSESFYAAGNKSTTQAPAWLKGIGLDAYEYEAGNGLTAKAPSLTEVGRLARENGISMSFHAPYFISLSSTELDKRLKSIDYIATSLGAAELLGADTIVVHTGSAAKISREEALRFAADTVYKTLEALPDNGVKIGLETMGKINQLGTLEEVVALCKMSDRLVPVVDFGHMNSRELGQRFKTEDDYRRVFSDIAEALSDDTARYLHCHFSRIEWTSGGEKRHLCFSDGTYGPDFEPLMEAIYKESLYPRIICESAGTMAEDALTMKKYYLSLSK